MGWPWTEESKELPYLQSNGSRWPKISIVTPTLNQVEFIEETIRSVLLQNYPESEYIIIDGGSTDGTLEIIKKYEPWLSYWISEPDSGQSAAINKGLRRSGGVFCNWICSDDLLYKDAFYTLSPLLVNNYNSLIIGKGIRIDRIGRLLNETKPSTISNLEELLDIRKFWRKSDSIMQQSALYPLSIVKKIGLLNENNHFTMDYELWGRILDEDTKMLAVPIQIGIFRWYEGQKTSRFNEVTSSLISTALKLVNTSINIPPQKKNKLRIKIISYAVYYYYHRFRSLIGIKRKIRSLLK